MTEEQIKKKEVILERARRIREIEIELSNLRTEQNKEKEYKELEKNFEQFLKRPADWIIGKAHYESGVDKRGYGKFDKELFAYSINVSGNASRMYCPKAYITRVTYTYFHNVWTDGQQREFQRKLNDLVHEEIKKITESPTCILELMGLTGCSEDVLKRDFPEDKIEVIKESIWKERYKILDKFDISELIKIYSERILHGRTILRNYFEDKFSKAEFPINELKCRECGKLIQFSYWIERKMCKRCEYKAWEAKH